jgi:chromatin segregation and condensation protein Rec8/ScpA/Scc1 (kleisin family)
MEDMKYWERTAERAFPKAIFFPQARAVRYTRKPSIIQVRTRTRRAIPRKPKRNRVCSISSSEIPRKEVKEKIKAMLPRLMRMGKITFFLILAGS